MRFQLFLFIDKHSSLFYFLFMIVFIALELCLALEEFIIDDFSFAIDDDSNGHLMRVGIELLYFEELVESFNISNIDNFEVIVNSFNLKSFKTDFGFVNFLNDNINVLIFLSVSDINCLCDNDSFNGTDILEAVDLAYIDCNVPWGSVKGKCPWSMK